MYILYNMQNTFYHLFCNILFLIGLLLINYWSSDQYTGASNFEVLLHNALYPYKPKI
jgi:hypothetical protein